VTESTANSYTIPPRYHAPLLLKESTSTSVYRANDAIERQQVAIKVLHNSLRTEEDLLQFKSEFATLATLQHPGIIRVHDFGVLDGGFPYFTMEYLEGKRITEYFNGQNWDALYDVVIQIAAALHHIHTLGIIHFDLKPSNVLVSDAGRVKLMDFGVAAGGQQILDRKIRGTLHYMAPEVLRQDRVDARADLYALGMTLYETVTGALPTYGRPPIEIIRFHLDEEIRRPSAINPNIPERLERVIIRLLEKDPRDRYPSAAALLHDLASAASTSIAPGELLVGRGELLAAPLIGRAHEIDEIAQAITRAREGNGGGIIIAGAEGLGKSRIVREATRQAQLDGARVFVGRCPVNRKSIYAPFFEIFQQMLSAMNPEADAVGEIRRLLRPAPGEGKAGRAEKFRLYNRIVQSIQDFYGFLNVGSDGAPLILVIEDLQWVDPATSDLLAFLVGEARHGTLLVICTVTTRRSGETSLDEGSGAEEWEQRARDLAIPVVDVQPLSEDGVREYVEALLGGQRLPSEFVRWIAWESGGSPLHVRRIIDLLIDRDTLRFDGSGWAIDMDRVHTLRVPGGSAAIWNEKLESLDPKSRSLLQRASVLGDRFDLATLANVARTEAEPTYGTLRKLVARGLVDESTDGALFVFPQISLRETLYAGMVESERAELHRRAGEYLETRHGDAAEFVGQIAYHHARGSDHVKGIDYSIRAGELAAAALAHEQAGEFYRIALELMDLVGEEQRKPAIRERLGDAYYRAANYRGAMQVYQFLLKTTQARPDDDESHLRSAAIMKKIGKVLAKRSDYEAALSYFGNAIQIYERVDRSIDVAEILNRMAWIHKDKGDLAESERTASQAASLIERLPVATVHGYVSNIIGVIAYSRGDWQRARPHFERALAISEQLESAQLRKVATSNLAAAMWKLGEWDQALQHYRRNLERSEAEGDLWDLVTAYNNVAIIEFSRGNFQAAATLLEKSVRIDEKLGSPENEALAQENLGEALEMLGHWKEAREHYQRCLSIEGFDENRPGRISVYIPLARLTAKGGDLARGLAYAQKAYDAAERLRDEDLLAEAAFTLSVIERERENFGEATRFLNEARNLFENSATVHGLARVHTMAADLALRQQKLQDAEQSVAVAAEMAARLGDRFTAAQLAAVSGKVCFVTGRREEAELKFAEALQVFEELGTQYELGRLLFDVGLLREDADEAAQTIRRAVRIFERLEAAPDLERARGALFRIRPAGKTPESSVVGLYEIVKIINSTLNLEEVLNRVLDIVLRRLRAERGMILLIDPITSALRTRVARNIREGAEGESKRSPQAIIKEVIQSGRSIMSADARADERFVDSETVISENIVSTLCVPLIIRDRIAGAIYVDHRETRHLFGQRDLNFLEAFADQAAIAIDNARLYEELESARARLSLENESLRSEVLVEKHLDSLIGHSEAVVRVQFTIRKASSSASTVLLRGESGTGKGLVARIIHNVGPRRNGPFIKFNCAALPETLAESELFGHEKGAFTGADRRKLGRFELANGGTIFLDEIGKVSLAMQSKLLRVVEDKEFERVGGTQTIKSDVKIIAATNLDLERAIEDGSFREDLYYRLNIIPIHLKPLRERKEDIPGLVEHFIRKICKDLGIDTKRLEPGMLDVFASYHWPGNVRELEATLHRAIVMANDDVLTRNDFFGLLADPNRQVPDLPVSALPGELLNPMVKKMQITDGVYEDLLARVDRQLIVQALAESGGRIRETSRRLGLARNTLRAKLQRYGIDVER
jgi:Nif-specific regulatory protein